MALAETTLEILPAGLRPGEQCIIRFEEDRDTIQSSLIINVVILLKKTKGKKIYKKI